MKPPRKIGHGMLRACLAFAACLVSIHAGAGCSNINLGDAAELANTGGKASSAYASSISQTSGGIDRFVEAQYLVAPVRHLPEPDLAPPTGTVDCARSELSTAENIACVQEALAARRIMLMKLAQVYASFGALASYDAQKNMTDALTDLAGSVDQFAKTVGTSGAPAGAGAVTADVGGIFASEIQKRKVADASQAIRRQLTAVVPIIEKERVAMESLQRVLVTDAGVTAEVLYKNGIGTPDPILADNIGEFGLSYQPGSYSHACENLARSESDECKRNLERGIRAAVLLRAKRRAGDQAALIDSNVAAIKALSDAHTQLEAGQPIDLALVTQQLAALRGIVDDLNKSLKPTQ